MHDSSKSKRPKIGLTLSGGGAKGLAHIGILKAIDSAGLSIDYISGTSMGSIIGSLYAAGYSADSILYIARHMNWDQILSNQSSLRNIIMEEKDEYVKYDLELPWVNNFFRISTGVLEGQELWLKFSELLFPVYKIKNFDSLSIPFKCIATDISTGQAVVLDSGELVSAVRASMAIPSVFTAVEYNKHLLVDGGIVRNFPVKDVRQMGAQYVIGSNVTASLLPASKVNNALQVLLQVAFFREAEDTKLEVPLCNIYVQTPLEKYTMGTFTQADSIIEAGMIEGRKIYPQLKKLADSLNATYDHENNNVELPSVNSVKISSYEVNGLKNTTQDFFIHTTGLLTNHRYTPEMLSHLVRRAVGTRYYTRIVYHLNPQPDKSAKIIFDATESPLTFAKLSLHYNQFTGISAILNITSRDFFTPNSRSLATVNIGENFRIKAEHLQYLGRSRKFSLKLFTQFDQMNITTYNTTKEAGIYNQNYFLLDGKFGYSTSRNVTIGVGTRFEWTRYKPSITSVLEFRGTDDFPTSYIFIRHNSLDRPVYPKKGIRSELEGDWVYPQNPNLKLHTNSFDKDTATTTISYPRFVFHFESYSPLSDKSTLLFLLQSAINFQKGNIMNQFSIGGLTSSFNNQITFAGLREGSFYSSSVAALQAGFRYNLYGNLYVTARANVLFNNFVNNQNKFYNSPDFLSGYAFTFTYNFVLGPLELSAMYCDQWKRVMGYVNIGIPF
ncbi:MAG: patatin-like phospholipase family protein [Bacteroidota bacterium]|nr:patatin-like phospholipase family protein [Bacteroidota bacterium]